MATEDSQISDKAGGDVFSYW